jgi:hypothetical protein
MNFYFNHFPALKRILLSSTAMRQMHSTTAIPAVVEVVVAVMITIKG